jgi:hypothetical protein
MMVARQQAQEAIKQAQELLGCKSDHRPYQKDQWVWLKGKHLQTTHPSVKMCPKCFGPFKVTEILGKTMYRLELPSHWKIHNAFHASLLLPYKETEEHGAVFAASLARSQPENAYAYRVPPRSLKEICQNMVLCLEE